MATYARGSLQTTNGNKFIDSSSLPCLIYQVLGVTQEYEQNLSSLGQVIKSVRRDKLCASTAGDLLNVLVNFIKSTAVTQTS